MASKRTRRVGSGVTLGNGDEKTSNCNGPGSSESENRGGVFKRLRNRLSRQLSTNTTPVGAVKLYSTEGGRNNIKISQIQRRPLYICVPLPPGSIPSEVMLITDNQTQAFPSASPSTEDAMENQSPEEIHGIKKTQEEDKRERETHSENAVGRSKEECQQHDVLVDVMYNNWVDPEC